MPTPPWISPCKSCKSLCGPSTALPEALEHWGLEKGIQLTLKRWVSRPFSLAVVDPDLTRPTSVVALAPNINHESTIGPPRLSTAQFLVQTCPNIFFPQEEQVGLPATGGYHYFCMAMLSGKKVKKHLASEGLGVRSLTQHSSVPQWLSCTNPPHFH